jgi:hypothetical protein
MRREDEHHVQEIGHLAESAFAPFIAESRGRLVCFFDELRGDRGGAAIEELG